MSYRDKFVKDADDGLWLGTNYPVADGQACVNQFKSYLSGANDPLKRAENACTSYGWQHVRYTQRCQSYVGERWTWYGFMCNQPADLNPVVDNYLEVWGKLQTLFQGHDLNAGVALAEGHKTVATVLGGLSRLTRSMKLLRSGNVVGALTAIGVQTRDKGKSYDVRAGTKAHRSGLRRYRIKKDPKVDFAGSWLELQYGWKPLLSDIRESVNLYYSRYGSKTRALTFRASKAQNVGFKPLQVVSGKFEKPFEITPDVSGWKPENSNVLGIKALITAPTPIASELGLLDPVSIAWELVPLSFVADWFIPIGNFLSALSFAQRTTGTFSTKSLRRITWRVKTSGARWLSSPGNPGSWFVFDALNYKWDGHSYRSWTFNRAASQPITTSTFLTSNSLPTFKPLVKAASASHVVSAIALLRVAARS